MSAPVEFVTVAEAAARLGIKKVQTLTGQIKADRQKIAVDGKHPLYVGRSEVFFPAGKGRHLAPRALFDLMVSTAWSRPAFNAHIAEAVAAAKAA
jgi:hypothetical protein